MVKQPSVVYPETKGVPHRAGKAACSFGSHCFYCFPGVGSPRQSLPE